MPSSCSQQQKKKTGRRPALALIAQRDVEEGWPGSVSSRREREYISWVKRIVDETTELPGSLQALTASTALVWFRMCDVGSLWALSVSCRCLRGRPSAFGTASLLEVAAALGCRDLYRQFRPKLPPDHHVPFGAALLPTSRGRSSVARPSWLARLRSLYGGFAVAVGSYADKSGNISMSVCEIVDGAITELSRRPMRHGSRGFSMKNVDLACVNCRGSLVAVLKTHDPLLDAAGATTTRQPHRRRRAGSWDDDLLQRERRTFAGNNDDYDDVLEERFEDDHFNGGPMAEAFPGIGFPENAAMIAAPPLLANNNNNNRRHNEALRGRSQLADGKRKLGGDEAVRWDPSTARWHIVPLWRGQATALKCPALRDTNFRRALCVDSKGRFVVGACECRRLGADRRHRPRPPFQPDRDELDCRPWRFARRNAFPAGPEEDDDDDDGAKSNNNHEDDDDDNNMVIVSNEDEKKEEREEDPSSSRVNSDASEWTALPTLEPWRETATVELVSVDFKAPVEWSPDLDRVDLFRSAPNLYTMDHRNGRTQRPGARHCAQEWLKSRVDAERRRRSARRRSGQFFAEEEPLLVAVTTEGKAPIVAVSVYVLDETLGAWVQVAVDPFRFRGTGPVSAAAVGNDVVVAAALDKAIVLNLETLAWTDCRLAKDDLIPHHRPSSEEATYRNDSWAPPPLLLSSRHEDAAAPPARLCLSPGPSADAASAIVLTSMHAAIYDLKRDAHRKLFFQRTALAPITRDDSGFTTGESPPFWTTLLLPLPL